MALPHQVGLTITYDGTTAQASTQTVSSGGGGTYTVVAGDTLWSIAKRYYGSGTKHSIIYNANYEVIEAAAKARGKSNSSNGHWIWAGTVLTIPEVETTPKKTSLVTKGTSNPQLGKQIEKQATSFSYTDVASGKSDSVSITIADIGMDWLGSLMPKRGASLGASLKLTNWNKEEKTDTFNCGTFILDDISFSGRPLNCVLNGVSVPAMNDFKSLPRTKTWEKTTVEDIAKEISKRASVSLYYEAGTIQIAELEQNNQTDSAFLYSLCEKYGLAMKVYNHKIVIFDIVAYEAKPTILTLHEKDMLSWSYNITVDGTYTGVNLNYTDPDSKDDKTIKVTIGSTGRMYEIKSQASSQYDAELQAIAAVNAANRKIETMEVSIRANIKIVASHCIEIAGLGNASGKYFIDTVKHNIGSGYKMQLTLHKVQAPINVTAKASNAGGTYTVVAGDTLWSIAKKYYGSGTKHSVIYNANVDVIEAAAKAHGKSNSGNGHWIWAGTVLTIPEV
jgi:nucleoid-associated protein YgaU